MPDVSSFMNVEPLKRLLEDRSVTEILVNDWDQVFIERDGHRVPAGMQFESLHQLRYAVERLVDASPGARVDRSSPMVDLALPDGSRANIVVPPAVDGGPHITIRKFHRPADTIEDFIGLGTLDDAMAAMLKAAVQAGTSILFSGGTGTGKTTLLEVLSRYIPEEERIITIEDTLELHLHQPDTVRLLGRAPNLEGVGLITLGQLFRNSLRMRPDRIILGEIRGQEVVDWLQAITSGHRGSMAVIHAATADEAILRIESLAMMSGRGVDRRTVRQQLSQGLQLVVQLDQHHDGVRRVTSITELARDPDDPKGFVLRDLWTWAPDKDTAAATAGRYVRTDVQPELYEHLRLAGVLPSGI